MAGFQTTNTIISTGLAAPSGHGQSTSATALVSVTIRESVTFSVAGSNRTTTAAAGFDAVISAIDTAVQGWIQNTAGVDIATKDVDYIATVYGIDLDSIYLNDATAAFSVKVDLQIRVY